MSLLSTVCYDMGPGLLIAIVFAVLTTIIRTQWYVFHRGEERVHFLFRPRWHVLSRHSDGSGFRETKKSELEMVEGNVCVFRMDAPLIFTSVDNFTAAIWACVKKWERSKIESFVTIAQMNAAETEDVFDSVCLYRIPM